DHPVTNVVSAPNIGSFAQGETVAVTNIVFSNTGIVKGTVRRSSGTPVAGAVAKATSSAFSATYKATAGDGAYIATAIPPGPITISAGVQHPQSTFGTQTGRFLTISGSAAITVVAGQTITRDLTLQPTGSLAGTVTTATGALAVNAIVDVLGVDPG